MILLDTTTKSLQILLSGAVTANQLTYVAGYADLSATGTVLAESDGLTNNGTAVTPVSAPAASTVRKVLSFNVQNTDTVAAELTVRVNNNGTFRKLIVVTLDPGSTLTLTNEGWRVVNTDGQFITAAAAGSIADHNHTSSSDGGVLTNDLHDGYSEFAGISAPSAPASGSIRLFASTSQSHTRLEATDPDGTVLRLNRDNVLLVKNTTVSIITKGQAVTLNGVSGGVPTVTLADADSVALSCDGLANEQISVNGFGYIMVDGLVTGLDTSAFTAGDTLYLSQTAGAVTITAPSEPALKQRIGVVTVANVSVGAIEVARGFTEGPPRLHQSTHNSGGTDALKLDDLAAPDDNTDLNASTSAHGLVVKATAPASGLVNYVGIGNGETAYTNKALFDTTNPAALGTAGPGTSTIAARRDHVHANPAIDTLAAATDITTLNASTSAHGLLPKLDNVVTHFLNGQGGWTAPSAAVKPNLQWTPAGNQPPASAYATPDTRNSHLCLDFDGSTDEEAIFCGVLDTTYSGGGLTCETWWSFTSATSGSLRVQAAIERMDVSSLDIDADSFAAFNSAGGTAPGTSGQFIKVTVTFASGAEMDSLAAGEAFRLKIRRDADGTSGTDDITTDAELLRVVLRET